MIEEHLLGELIDIQSGYSFKSKEYSEEGHFLVRIGNVQDGYLTLDKPKYVALDSKTERFALKEGDFLTSLTGNIGRVARVQKSHLPAALNQRVAKMTIKDASPLSTDYCYYFLISDLFKEELSAVGHGAAQQNVSPTAIGRITIPLPPVPEQKRIVAILDEVFEGITRAVANAEKNLANARELFESYLNNVFTQKGEGWVEKPFGDICAFVRGPFGGTLKKSCFVDDGYAVYEQQHAINNQFVQIRYFIDRLKFDAMSRFELHPGDLVMSCSGTMGRVAIVPDKIPQGIINQALLKLSPSQDLEAEFLKYWMESISFQEQIALHSKGAAIKNVASVKVLKMINVPVPSISVQNNIVSKLNNFMLETQRLESLYQQKLKALAELKQSILQKAFTGELTADMARQEVSA